MLAQMMMMAAKPAALLFQAAQSFQDQLTSDQKFEIAKAALQRGSRLTDQIVPLALFAMIFLICLLGLRRKQALIRAQAELRKQLLDKFTSAQELTAFLETKGGQEFLGDMAGQTKGPLRFLSGGIITTMLGLAFLGLTLKDKGLIVPAVLLLAVGAGLLISAAIAHKLAAKKDDPTINSGSGMQHLPPA